MQRCLPPNKHCGYIVLSDHTNTCLNGNSMRSRQHLLADLCYFELNPLAVIGFSLKQRTLDTRSRGNTECEGPGYTLHRTREVPRRRWRDGRNVFTFSFVFQPVNSIKPNPPPPRRKSICACPKRVNGDLFLGK